MSKIGNLFIVLSFCLAGLFVGCGVGPVTDYSQLGLVEVGGTVTLDGKPVDGAAVYFYAEDETYCFGVTDAAGRYDCMLNSEKSGITPGEKRVEISTASNPLGDAAELFSDGIEAEEDPDARRVNNNGEEIPACYNSNSTLTVIVSEAVRELNFGLKSDCSTPSN